MRVLALAAEAFGGRGGIAQSTRDLMLALAGMPQIRQIDILPRLQRENDPKMPAGIRQFPSCKSRLGYIRRAFWLAATSRPDLVYCGHAYMAPLAHLVALISGAKLLSHVHGLEVWQPLSGAVRRGLAASDLVYCVSHYTAEKVTVAADADRKRCAIIYNTVGEQFVPADRARARARFGIPVGAVVLSTVSRLDPGQRHKGHDRIIPLLSDLAQTLPGLTYLIAGTGGDRGRLEALAHDAGAGEIVRFLGFVPDTDLADLYRASDLYVMPSHGEGFGIAFVEAMACGTPALGLDLGGAGCALRNGELGRAVTEADFPAALAAALSAQPHDRSDLAARTRAIFGRPQFEARFAKLTEPVLTSHSIQEKAPIR